MKSFLTFSVLIFHIQISISQEKDSSRVPVGDFNMNNNPQVIYFGIYDIKSNGVGYLFYNDGKLKVETSFRKRRILKKRYKMDGLTIEYRENGTVSYIGCYRNNKKVGLWKRYSEDGKVIKEEYWKSNAEIGFKYL